MSDAFDRGTRRRFVQFPSFPDYQVQRVFPLIEKTSWVGAVMALLAVARDGAQTGGREPFLVLAAFHGFMAVLGAVMAVIVRRWTGTVPRLFVILVGGSLGQVISVVTVLFVLPEPQQIPALLSFFFLTFLFLAPLINRLWLAVFYLWVLVEMSVLLGVARATAVPGVDDALMASVFGFLVASLVFIGLLVFWARRQALEAYRHAWNDHLHLCVDGLSQVLNRATWWERAEARRRRLVQADRGASVLMVDIDHFKSVNDSRGHDAGDEVIRFVARVLVEQTRDDDLVGRLGGEEFAIFFPEATLEVALDVAERIRRSVEAGEPVSGVRVTVSLGVVEVGSHDLAQAVKQADLRLYEAKGSGRNRIAAARER